VAAVEDSGQLVYAAAAVSCVVVAGVVSGLTLGLLSLSPLRMQILARTGTPEQRSQVCVPSRSPAVESDTGA
jgi:hypothetical protein